MRRSMATAWVTTWMAAATLACLTTGCLSGGYDDDFKARLQQYKLEAAGEPPAADPAADPAAAAEAPAGAGDAE